MDKQFRTNREFSSYTSRSKATAAVFLFGAAVFLNPVPPASAFFGGGGSGVVYCTNCSTTTQQAAQLIREIETAVNTYQQLQTQLQQYQDMVTQGLNLPGSVFNQLTSDLQQLSNLYQQGKALAGQLANFDQDFRAQFRDYEDYLTQLGQDPNFINQNHRRWNEQGFEAMRVAMHAAGMNVSAIADEDALLGQIVQRSATAEGRLQAIQAGNEIAAQQVQQMQKLRQMLNAQVQSQSQYYAYQVERETVNAAAVERWLSDEVTDGETAGKSFRIGD